VDLSVENGERIAIVGPSGQGKSTLLKIMAGLLKASRGQVEIEGHDFHKLSHDHRQKLRCRMGMLFQKNALFDSLLVGENIAFPLREVTKSPEQEIQTLVVKGLESVGILHAKDLFPDEMSGGMQKRLGIARAQALNPDFLFYDDPTAGLDPITSRKIIDLIISLQEKKSATIFVVTNEMSRAFQVGHRVWYVGEKRVVDLGPPAQAKQTQDPKIRAFLRGEVRAAEVLA
jgi:phospholipid/cholesterol/gamma-HCH transport system ATP-binding protein